VILALVFVFSLTLAYLGLRPINHLDWVTTAQFLRYQIQLESPYSDDLIMDTDLAQHHDDYVFLPYAPWTVFYFGFLAYATTRLIVAMMAAAWMIIVIDSGKPFALILVLHPVFILAWASGNLEFLVNGVGLWLIIRGVRGWRLAVGLMLMAIKPQVLPLLILLEGVRILWERDWEALVTVAIIFAVSNALYPGWLEWMADKLLQYFDVMRGAQEQIEVSFGGGSYPFSVFGAWGFLPALGVSLLIMLLMLRRWTEWRTLAVMLSLVWTPYINPYSYVVLLVLMRNAKWWCTLIYLAVGIVSLPVLFAEWHSLERYGLLLFLLLVPLLTPRDRDQYEEQIAVRHHVQPLPLVKHLKTWQARVLARLNFSAADQR
jgi:hypothetical protein